MKNSSPFKTELQACALDCAAALARSYSQGYGPSTLSSQKLHNGQLLEMEELLSIKSLHKESTDSTVLFNTFQGSSPLSPRTPESDPSERIYVHEDPFTIPAFQGFVDPEITCDTGFWSEVGSSSESPSRASSGADSIAPLEDMQSQSQIARKLFFSSHAENASPLKQTITPDLHQTVLLPWDRSHSR